MICGSFLTAPGVDWVEDPSNQDLRALRPRLRQGLAACVLGQRTGAGDVGGRRDAAARRKRRSPPNWRTRATIRPEGFALLSAGPDRRRRAAVAWSRTIGGAAYPPSPARSPNWRGDWRPRAGDDWRRADPEPDGWATGMLIVREEAAIAGRSSVDPARSGTTGSAWSLGRLRRRRHDRQAGATTRARSGGVRPAVGGFADPSGDPGRRKAGRRSRISAMYAGK